MYTCSRTEPPSQFGRMGKRTAHKFKFPKIQQVLEQKLKLLNHNLHRNVEIELQAEMLNDSDKYSFRQCWSWHSNFLCASSNLSYQDDLYERVGSSSSLRNNVGQAPRVKHG